jgi:putative protein kinase ArgK-like GTPase of G3E family
MTPNQKRGARCVDQTRRVEMEQEGKLLRRMAREMQDALASEMAEVMMPAAALGQDVVAIEEAGERQVEVVE